MTNYRLIYKIDFTATWVTEFDYELQFKKMCWLLNSLPEYALVEDNTVRPMPPFDANADTVFSFTLILREIHFLQQALQFFNSFCELYYIEPDSYPTIVTLEGQ